ncbi:MAG TPA: class IV adenylate cyclase [Planctomycetaceae bacterium]|nr:class IV adenylate cyclase [Planctomycetaceae bacterium]
MTYEVELKFPIADASDVTLQLIARGATPGRVVHQYDVYFRHPSRDFQQTHEAFRIRRYEDDVFITYKGPVLDKATKTRREIEIAVGRRPEDFDRMRELLVMLGFEPVRPVEKTRALFHLAWEGRELELAVDSIDDLGTYLEIEALAEENDRDAARDGILRLAERLGLQNPERRSYLALMLEWDARQLAQKQSDPVSRG